MLRWLKIILVVFVALQGLFYALQNLVNLQAAHAFVSSVLSMANHAVYPNHFGPALGAAPLTWTALGIIIAGEFAVGLLALQGAYDMFASRRASAAVFAHAKRYAILACGVAVALWFGLFMVLGGAYFQMWQTPEGSGAFHSAFMYAAIAALVMIFLATHED